MPRKPIDSGKSMGEGFQNLVPQRRKTPAGVWVIVGMAIFFMVVAFGIAGYIVYHALAQRHAAQLGSGLPAASAEPTPGPSGSTTAGSTPGSSAASASATPAEEDATRKAVLTRIDLMRNLSNKEKDQLYAQVERARGFKKLALIPFQTGRSSPDKGQIDDLIAKVQEPDNQKMLSDPTVLLFFVGYADTQGNEEKNLEISRDRAEAVQKQVSARLKLANLMHSVGMGGQELFDKTNREKNRVVEIWAVQP